MAKHGMKVVNKLPHHSVLHPEQHNHRLSESSVPDRKRPHPALDLPMCWRCTNDVASICLLKQWEVATFTVTFKCIISVHENHPAHSVFR